MISWSNLDYDYQPVEDCVSEARFFEYPELQEALRDNLDLAILWLGGNDITMTSSPQHILHDIYEVTEAFESSSTRVVIMTIELHNYPEGHPHYERHQLHYPMPIPR